METLLDLRPFFAERDALRAENERLQERVAELQVECGYTESIQTLKIERLTAALKRIAEHESIYPARLEDAAVMFQNIAINTLNDGTGLGPYPVEQTFDGEK